MKITYVSDLHLDHSNMSLSDLNTDVLVLAGDIAADFNLLYNLISYQIPEQVQIVFVPGNHEFENKDICNALQMLNVLEKEFKNFYCLYNKSVVIGGVKFIGTTLWTNFESSGLAHKQQVMDWCKNNVADFSFIYKDRKLITPLGMESEFIKACEFLHFELCNPSDYKKLVVTHFAPSRLSVSDKFSHDIMSAYWVNDLPHLLGFCDYWIHGHTHETFDYNVEGTNVLCNPRGYSKTFDLSSNVLFSKDRALMY